MYIYLMKFKLHIHMKLKATWIDYNYIAPIYFFRQQKILHEPVLNVHIIYLQFIQKLSHCVTILTFYEVEVFENKDVGLDSFLLH